jgi:hypothetical protein
MSASPSAELLLYVARLFTSQPCLMGFANAIDGDDGSTVIRGGDAGSTASNEEWRLISGRSQNCHQSSNLTFCSELSSKPLGFGVNSNRSYTTVELSQLLSRLSPTPVDLSAQSRETSKDAQALRSRRNERGHKFLSSKFFWESETLKIWATSTQSALILLKGTHQNQQQIEDISLKAIDFIEAEHVPVIWALSSLTKAMGTENLSKPVGVTVLEQLCLQLLRKNSTLHSESAITTILSRFTRAKTESEWFNILGSCIEGLPQVYIVVDLEILGRRDPGSLSWLVAFKDLFSRLNEGNHFGIVKVVVFDCRSSAGIDESSLCISFPRNSSNQAYKRGFLQLPSQNRKSTHGKVRLPLYKQPLSQHRSGILKAASSNKRGLDDGIFISLKSKRQVLNYLMLVE